MKSVKENSNLLRRALQGNGVFSIVSGIVFLVGAKPIAAAIGLAYPLVLSAIGLSLLFFAAGVFRNAARERVNRIEAALTVTGDLVWVVGSVVVVALGPLNSAGNWLVAGVADIVLLFAIVQFAGLRKVNAG